MTLTKAETIAIANYVKLELNDAQAEQMTSDLNSSVDLLEPITKYKLNGVEPTFHPIAGMTNVMRSDELGESLAIKEALDNAGQTEQEQFRIPPILAVQ